MLDLRVFELRNSKMYVSGRNLITAFDVKRISYLFDLNLNVPVRWPFSVVVQQFEPEGLDSSEGFLLCRKSFCYSSAERLYCASKCCHLTYDKYPDYRLMLVQVLLLLNFCYYYIYC
jgi:hypothetical protein